MIYVLYHGNCYDGFGAAYAAWKKYGDQAKYISVSYGYPPPEMPNATDIYIVDFSYQRETLIKLSEKATLVVLDHHKTAEAELKDLVHPRIDVYFDMERSGAGMSWDYFHEFKSRPKLIDHIEDRDLWRFHLDGTAKIHKALVSLPMDFEVWDKLDVEQLKKDGEIAERLYTQLVENTCQKAWKTKIDSHEVPVVNTAIAWSEVGHHLLEIYPDAPFVASFTIMKNSVMWSLRSKGAFDVSEIAKKFGGGGHKNAAGFKTARF